MNNDDSDNSVFKTRLKRLTHEYEKLISLKNNPIEESHGIFERYKQPVLTGQHVPLTWRFDLNPSQNPYLLERMGINSVFNPGAIKWGDLYILIARIEGKDRKSFFAIAESQSPVEGFRFRKQPLVMPELADPDINIYDIRLTHHEDGWIYGVYCTERKDPEAPQTDSSSAITQAAICRTKDLEHWERLDDLQTPSKQQRNVVLHPELVDGKYAFYTRPQDSFIVPGSGGGIGWGLADDIKHAKIEDETILDPKIYHTIKELKNGEGPTPIKTEDGWIHLAHGVRNTAAGMRYVLYLYVTNLREPWKVIYEPSGYLIAPHGDERVGDVSNVVFCNGWIKDQDDKVYFYYGSSDTRVHVAESSVERLLDYAKNTPADAGRSLKSTEQRLDLIEKNRQYLEELE